MAKNRPAESKKTNPIQSQTKPILGKGKSKKAKGKNESKSGVFPAGRLKKQSQFASQVKRRNVSNINGLWRFWRMKAAKKQSQFKAKQSQSPAFGRKS